MKFIIFTLIIILILNNFNKKEYFSNINKINNYYYINLDRHHDRKKYMETQFQNHKLNINRFKAFDKKLINPAYLDDLEKKNIILSKTQIKNKKKEGSLACLISHTNLWKKIYSEKKGNISLIFEDDCQILPNFQNKLNIALQNAPEDWDMIWLGYNNVKGDKVSEYYYKPYPGFNKGFNTQHHCYLVKTSSIPKILNIVFPVPISFTNKDSILRNNFNKFNAYFYKEKLAVQDNQTFPFSERTGNKNG